MASHIKTHTVFLSRCRRRCLGNPAHTWRPVKIKAATPVRSNPASAVVIYSTSNHSPVVYGHRTGTKR